MFAFDHWTEWTQERVARLAQEGAEATFTFTDESKASDNPTFFVDLGTSERMGRIIIWSDADYDVHAIEVGTKTTIQITGWPTPATDNNFEEIFDHFVALVTQKG